MDKSELRDLKVQDDDDPARTGISKKLVYVPEVFYLKPAGSNCLHK